MSQEGSKQNVAQKGVIKISVKRGFEVIPLDTIQYIKADNNYSIFHCIDRDPIMVSKSIGLYEISLIGSFFTRIHKSTIVNLKYVRSYEHYKGHYLILSTNVELQIARRRVPIFIRALEAYLDLKE